MVAGLITRAYEAGRSPLREQRGDAVNVDTGQFEVIITEQVAALAAKVKSTERREEARNALAALRAMIAAGNPLSGRQLEARFGLTRAEATRVRPDLIAAESNGHHPDRSRLTPGPGHPANSTRAGFPPKWRIQHVNRTTRRPPGQLSRSAPPGRRPRCASTRTSRPARPTSTHGGRGERRPIIPAHWRTWQDAKRHLSLIAARHGHRAAYHSVRSPAYFAKAARVRRVGRDRRHRRLIAWWHIPGTTQLEYQAAADGLLNDHLRLHKQGRETRKARGTDPRALPGRAVIVAVPWARTRHGGRGRWPPSPCSWRSRWPGGRTARRSPPKRYCPPRCSRPPRT